MNIVVSGKNNNYGGRGVMKYVSGDVYDGEWRFGKKEGERCLPV